MRASTLLFGAGVLTALAWPSETRSADLGSVGERLLDLSPARIHAFQRTMRDFGGLLAAEEAAAAGLRLESRYDAPPILQRDGAGSDLADELVIPVGAWGSDPIADEQFLIAGREDDFEDAATSWLARRVKGSDAAAAARGNRLAPRFAWDDGPIVGVRKGPISASIGEDQWQVRFVHRISRWPGWAARVTVGHEDGDDRIAFTIGRSLRAATQR